MSDPRKLIEEAEAVSIGVTPGPWEPDYCTGPTRPHDAMLHMVGPTSLSDGRDAANTTCAVTGDGPDSEANAAFIAASRSLIPALADALSAALDERDALHGQLDPLVAVLASITNAAKFCVVCQSPIDIREHEDGCEFAAALAPCDCGWCAF